LKELIDDGLGLILW